jgi:GDP-4-dehydro-6-deoxy-D-mannose reductase
VTAALLRAGAEAVLGVGRSPRADEAYTHDIVWRGAAVRAPTPVDLLTVAADPRYHYQPADLADEDRLGELLRAFAPEVVIHTAASLRDSGWQALIASNLHATVGLVRAAARSGRPRLVLTSSGSVYGAGRGRLPLREDGPAEPVDPYGVTKRAAEDIARVLGGEHGMTVVTGRVFNLVGPGLQERHLPALLASRIAAAALHPGPHELALGPLDATRDFIDVRDAAEALVLLASMRDPPPLANVASGRETRVRQVLDLLVELAGRPPLRLVPAPARSSEIPRAVADVGLMAAAGFRARHALEDSLRLMLAYYERLGGG